MSYRAMIAAQPESVARCLDRAQSEVARLDIGPFASGLIAVTGIGASYAAATVVAGELTRRGRRAVVIRAVDPARSGSIADSIIALSQGGESIEPVELLKAHPATPALMAGDTRFTPAESTRGIAAPESTRVVTAAARNVCRANAVVAARSRIVEGAVGMVDMALARLDEKGIVDLDEERKAAMVSNLMVVLCGDQPASPIVNTGTLYT